MVRLSTLVAALTAFMPATLAYPANGPCNSLMGCGTEPSAAFLAKSEEIAALEANSSVAEFTSSAAVAATITIQTYFHVVARSSAASGGYIPQSQLTQQLAVMNSNYGALFD
jgi:hypothetical protein